MRGDGQGPGPLGLGPGSGWGQSEAGPSTLPHSRLDIKKFIHNQYIQQDVGHTNPLKVTSRKQHCPVLATHLTGPPHSESVISPIPAAPEDELSYLHYYQTWSWPTRPRPPRTGASPPSPRVWPATPLTKAKAVPPPMTPNARAKHYNINSLG